MIVPSRRYRAPLQARRTSLNVTELIEAWLGPVTTTRLCGRVYRNHRMIPAAHQLLPTALPLATSVSRYVTTEAQISRCRDQTGGRPKMAALKYSGSFIDRVSSAGSGSRGRGDGGRMGGGGSGTGGVG